MKNVVITIGREYGSGGKYIGQMVAKRLNIPFYDKEIINETYEVSGCNYSKLEEYDEVKRNSIFNLLNLLQNNGYDENDSTYYVLVSDTIKRLASSGSCVILGRNSNNILSSYKNAIHLFIYSNDLDFKVRRKMDIENIDYDSALSRLKSIDRKRRKYYESINKNCIWGDRSGYDYLIDSSILGIDGTIELIVGIYNKYCNEKKNGFI